MCKKKWGEGAFWVESKVGSHFRCKFHIGDKPGHLVKVENLSGVDTIVKVDGQCDCDYIEYTTRQQTWPGKEKKLESVDSGKGSEGTWRTTLEVRANNAGAVRPVNDEDIVITLSTRSAVSKAKSKTATLPHRVTVA